MRKYKSPIKKESAKAIYYLFNKIISKSIIIIVLLFLIFSQGFFMVLQSLYWSQDSAWPMLSDPYLYFSFISPVAYSLMICPFVYKSISNSVFSNRLGSSAITKFNFIFIIWSIFFLSSLFIWLLIIIPTGIYILILGGLSLLSFGSFIGLMCMSILFIGLLTSIAIFIGSLPISKIGVLFIGMLITTLTLIISFGPNGFDGIAPPEEYETWLLIWKIVIVINPLSPFLGLIRFFPGDMGDISWYWYCFEALVSIILSSLLIFGSIKIHKW